MFRVRGPFDVFDASFNFVESHSLIGLCKFFQRAFFNGFDLANLVLKAVVAGQKQKDQFGQFTALSCSYARSYTTDTTKDLD